MILAKLPMQLADCNGVPSRNAMMPPFAHVTSDHSSYPLLNVGVTIGSHLFSCPYICPRFEDTIINALSAL